MCFLDPLSPTPNIPPLMIWSRFYGYWLRVGQLDNLSQIFERSILLVYFLHFSTQPPKTDKPYEPKHSQLQLPILIVSRELYFADGNRFFCWGCRAVISGDSLDHLSDYQHRMNTLAEQLTRWINMIFNLTNYNFYYLFLKVLLRCSLQSSYHPKFSLNSAGILSLLCFFIFTLK